MKGGATTPRRPRGGKREQLPTTLHAYYAWGVLCTQVHKDQGEHCFSIKVHSSVLFCYPKNHHLRDRFDRKRSTRTQDRTAIIYWATVTKANWPHLKLFIVLKAMPPSLVTCCSGRSEAQYVRSLLTGVIDLFMEVHDSEQSFKKCLW